MELTIKMPTIKVKSTTQPTVSNTENTSVPIKVMPETPETTETLTTEVPSTAFSVPKSLFTGFTDVLRQQQVLLARNVAEEFGIDYDDLVAKCLPDQPKMEIVEKPKPKKASKSKKVALTDYTQAQTLEDLKSFKMGDLKAILEENDLPISGSKPILMARVWGILHPDQAPVEPKKKRGRPAKAKSPSTVTKEPDQEECELDAGKMPDFFVDSEDAIQDESTDTTTTYKLLKDKYIFMEGTDEMEFKGYVEDGSITWTEDIPDDLLKMLGMED
jgi:hypothetical protein